MVSARPLALLLLLLMPIVAADSLQGLDYLVEHPAPTTTQLEVALQYGLDPYSWPSPAFSNQLHLPEARDEAPCADARMLEGLIRWQGASYDDPQRGTLDLRQELQDRTDCRDFPGAVAYLARGERALGENLGFSDRLVALDQGGWACWPGGAPDPECTAFAILALGAASPDARALLHAAIESERADPEPNVQVLAWSARALDTVGEDTEDTAAFLWSLQSDNGAFPYAGSANAWATGDALAYLASHPAPHQEQRSPFVEPLLLVLSLAMLAFYARR